MLRILFSLMRLEVALQQICWAMEIWRLYGRFMATGEKLSVQEVPWANRTTPLSDSGRESPLSREIAIVCRTWQTD